MLIKFSCLAENERLDKFLADIFKNFTRSYISKLINDKKVFVNKNIKKSSYKVKKKDEITIELLPPKKIDLIPQKIDLEILYEDRFIIVINKPANIVVHPSAGHYDNTIVNALLYHCKDLSSISGEIRPGIVHRLDKKTSGILIVAKTNDAHLKLTENFKNRKIKKFYYALLYGKLPEKEGVIKNYLGRHKTNRLKMSSFTNHGKLAITHYKVIEYIDNFTLVDIQLETGRTHQIRVHFSEYGYPVVGDDLYVSKNIIKKLSNKIKIKIEELDRYFLHSYKVIFNHPITNNVMEIKTELPEELKNFITFLKDKRD